jgi:hypothetical protein
MPLSDLDGLLPSLRNAFGETALFPPVVPGDPPVPIAGRFRIDPWDVSLGVHDPLNTTQTWFYCDRRDVPSAGKPGVGDYLFIRDEWWEIAQLDADDIGELGYRLMKGAQRAAAYPDTFEDQGARH